MANPPSSFDKWRDYFRSINTDIFNIIEHAIVVAAKDYPYDFKLKRDRITEVLFACKVTKCVGCDKIELAVPTCVDDDSDLKRSDGVFDKSGYDVGGSKDTKESKVNGGINRASGNGDGDDDHEELLQMVENHLSVCSYGDAEALTDEIDEESQFVGEVSRIKGVIDNSDEVSSEVLLDSLRRLQLMPLSVETLKATEIGKSVNGLRKHRSKDIRNLTKTLIEDWKVMVDDWVRATAAIAEAESGSAQKTRIGEEEEGLPSPPLDEAAFFATPNSMELSQFFDGMDDDLNFQIGGEFDKNQESGMKPAQEKPTRRIESCDNVFARPKEKKPEPKRNQEQPTLKKQNPLPKSNKPQNNVRPNPPIGGELGTRRQKPDLKPKVNDEKGTTALKKPMPPQREKLNENNEASVQMKLEVAKRKLHERYQEAERAKKQRTVQVVELSDLPKQRNQHANAKPVAQNRHWANGRR